MAMKIFKVLMVMGVMVGGVACTEVLPRQRGNLALPQMALPPDALEFGLRQHVGFSKEAGTGGSGGGGGGCGCN